MEETKENNQGLLSRFTKLILVTASLILGLLLIFAGVGLITLTQKFLLYVGFALIVLTLMFLKK